MELLSPIMASYTIRCSKLARSMQSSHCLPKLWRKYEHTSAGQQLAFPTVQPALDITVYLEHTLSDKWIALLTFMTTLILGYSQIAHHGESEAGPNGNKLILWS